MLVPTSMAKHLKSGELHYNNKTVKVGSAVSGNISEAYEQTFYTSVAPILSVE